MEILFNQQSCASKAEAKRLCKEKKITVSFVDQYFEKDKEKELIVLKEPFKPEIWKCCNHDVKI